MTRVIDWYCPNCHRMIIDALAREDEQRGCPDCHRAMSQRWWGTRKAHGAQWSDSEAIMVHVDPKTGDVRYPGRHDGKLKEGYERRYIRSLPEANRFEREHSVCNQRLHYDRNGRDLADSQGSH